MIQTCHHTVNTDIDPNNERSVFIEQRMPKAIKLHSCDECNRLIIKGEQYIREILKFDSKLFHHKYCDDCYSVREVFFSSGWYYTYMWEQMSDFVCDSKGSISEYQLTSLTKPARDKICDMMEEFWNAN